MLFLAPDWQLDVYVLWRKGMKTIDFFVGHPPGTMPNVLVFQNTRGNITATNHEIPTSKCNFETGFELIIPLESTFALSFESHWETKDVREFKTHLVRHGLMGIAGS